MNKTVTISHSGSTRSLTGVLFSPGVKMTYFTTPRPVYELYDLSADPSELSNLSGQPEVAVVERELREALAEKMILDGDHLPLPELSANTAARTRR